MEPNLYQLKIVANETRFKIVTYLMQGAFNVGELERLLKVEQSLLSHHLKKLRQARLVVSKRRGKEVYYSLSSSNTPKGVLDLGCCQLKIEGNHHELSKSTLTRPLPQSLLPQPGHTKN